jgi:hypothetical protein
MPGAGRTHGPRAKKNARGGHHRFSRDIPAFPAQWLYGLYVISSGTGVLAPVVSATSKRQRELGLSTGRPEPHDFAVRIGLFVGTNDRAATRHAHRVPRPTSVTIAIRPSSEAGRFKKTSISEKKKVKYSCIETDRSDRTERIGETSF